MRMSLYVCVCVCVCVCVRGLGSQSDAYTTGLRLTVAALQTLTAYAEWMPLPCVSEHACARPSAL
jgi:hypothetical protein